MPGSLLQGSPGGSSLWSSAVARAKRSPAAAAGALALASATAGTALSLSRSSSSPLSPHKRRGHSPLHRSSGVRHAEAPLAAAPACHVSLEDTLRDPSPSDPLPLPPLGAQLAAPGVHQAHPPTGSLGESCIQVVEAAQGSVQLLGSVAPETRTGEQAGEGTLHRIASPQTPETYSTQSLTPPVPILLRDLLHSLHPLALTTALSAAAALFLQKLPLHTGALPLSLPLKFSLFWGPPRRQSSSKPLNAQNTGSTGSQSQPLDWLYSALLRLGATRYGWRPPTSLTDRIVVLNCAVFALDWVLHRRLTLLGAKVNELILYRQQWWRLLTPALLHGGPLHLFMNCAALRNVGPPVETLLGRKRFLAVYGVSALAGCTLSLLLSPNPSVGASGAIFGLMGAFATFLFEKRDALRAQGSRDYFPVLARTVVLNLLLGAGVANNIDNWGHIGGLVAGSALMHWYIMRASAKNSGKKG